MKRQKLRIAVVSAFYSEGMGYTENCLPKALASMGHDVHVITSSFNVYGNTPDYNETYRAFLGPAQVGAGTSRVDGYQVHRLNASVVAGYVVMRGLSGMIRKVAPDVVHSMAIASLQTFELALVKPLAGYKLFCETHQHMSVVKPFLKQASGARLKKAAHRITRTLPTYLACAAVERCYAISPDCADVASRFYGVPQGKVRLQSLATDTDLFHPTESAGDRVARQALRNVLGFADDDVVCVYSGRLSQNKNPLLLAQAVDRLVDRDTRFKALFIGDGVQKPAISASRNAVVLPFMKHRSLAEHYRAADIAVWPTQESMSMLDAAASGLPLVVSDRIGARERVTGNGKVYDENNVDSLMDALYGYKDAATRHTDGVVGRHKMLAGYGWSDSARALVADYINAGAAR